MKKIIFLIAAFATFAAATSNAANAESEIITLDLTKSTTPLEFDTSNGSWTGTYDDDEESIDSQVFIFVHNSIADWRTWWGFTASKSADNSRPDNMLTHQWNNMAKGGIVLNEDGTVKNDDFGAPVCSADVPYLVAFYSPYMSARPVDVTFADGKSYNAVGMYVNLNSYAYYSIESGDGIARAFTNGDRFTLTVHGVDSENSEHTVDVTLAEYSNGDLTINRGWKYVDLSELGAVNELYFTMSSTDTGDYGMNTPCYFCLDKLMVSPAEDSGVRSVAADSGCEIKYDRESATVQLVNSDFAIVYDSAGNQVISSFGPTFSVRNLTAGVYLVRSGNKTLKIVK